MNNIEPQLNKYKTLLSDLREMLDQQRRGYSEAETMNQEFWHVLGNHQERLQEQVTGLEQSGNDPRLQERLSEADSIYEAAKTYLDNQKKNQ